MRKPNHFSLHWSKYASMRGLVLVSRADGFLRHVAHLARLHADRLEEVEAGLPRGVGDGVAPDEKATGLEQAVGGAEEPLVLVGHLAGVLRHVRLVDGDEVGDAIGESRSVASAHVAMSRPPSSGTNLRLHVRMRGRLHVDGLVGAAR